MLWAPQPPVAPSPNSFNVSASRSTNRSIVWVTGYGFVNSSQLQCNFTRANATSGGFVLRPATFIDYQNITCPSPAPGFGSLMGNTLEVTVDGQKMSSNANLPRRALPLHRLPVMPVKATSPWTPVPFPKLVSG